jgi:hypothetical protein
MLVGALPPGTPALIRWGRRAGRGLFLRAYLAGYAGIRHYDANAVRRWSFVRAVDRLADEIPEERELLIREARRLRLTLAAAPTLKPA